MNIGSDPFCPVRVEDKTIALTQDPKNEKFYEVMELRMMAGPFDLRVQQVEGSENYCVRDGITGPIVFGEDGKKTLAAIRKFIEGTNHHPMNKGACQ